MSLGQNSTATKQTLEPRPPSGRPSYALWLVPLLVIFVFVSFFGMKNYRRLTAAPDLASQAILGAQDAIRHQFRSGTRVRYTAREMTKVERTNGAFQIAGTLEAISPDGRIDEVYDYSCTATADTEGTWSVTEINLQPQ